jgi:hypothetical protein
MSLATVASVVGIASGANALTGGSLFGGGGGGGSGGGTGTYVPTGRGTADQTWQTLMPLIAQSIQQQQGNISGPVNAAYGATQPGGQFGFIPWMLQSFGNALVDQGRQGQTNQGLLSNAGNQIWQTAQDPQQALEAQLQQQVTDASRAGTSARGIGMSGEAAGIENQDVNNFLLQWQQAQLGRQLQGIQGMSTAMGQSANQANQVGRDLSGAGTMYTTGANFPFAAANAYTGAMSGPGSQFSQQLSPQLLAYLGLGNNASNQAFNQNQVGLNNLTTGLSQLGNIFNQQQPAAPIQEGAGAGNSYPGYNPSGT